MARNTKKERARERERERQERKQLNAWQEIVDEAHGEALIEDKYRTVEKEIRDRQSLYDEIGQKINDYNKQRTTDEIYQPLFEELDNIVTSSQANVTDNIINSTSQIDDIVQDSSKVKTLPTKTKNSNQKYKVTNGQAIKQKQTKYKTDIDSPFYNIYVNEEMFPNVMEKIKVAKPVLDNGSEDLAKTHLKKAFSSRNINALVNGVMAISDYKDARDSGDGVIKAGVKAGTQFVVGEALGWWAAIPMLAKSVPTLAITAVETAQSVTRSMNSSSRVQTFGEASFQDTQQLATMRQAGMELAKMSQYNLQQSIMGNEAQYMHRL